MVEPGEREWSIAKAWTGLTERWPELVHANPSKMTTSSGTFVAMTPGELLYVPVSWVEQYGIPRPQGEAAGLSRDAAGALPHGWSSSDLEIVDALARSWGVASEDLLSTWFAESGLQPHIVTPAGSYEYAGLIEGLTRPPVIDQTFGWPVGTWRRIVTQETVPVQLQAIAQIWDRTFKTYLKDTLGNYSDRMGVSPAAVIHALNFLPARVPGLKTLLSPITKAGDVDPGTKTGSYYGDNKGLDLDRDGAITLRDLDTQAAQMLVRLRGAPEGAILAAASSAPSAPLATLFQPIASTWQGLTGKPPITTVGYKPGAAPSSGGGGGALVVAGAVFTALYLALRKKKRR
jgi:hypothetical protein